jgi:hypothetical protein
MPEPRPETSATATTAPLALHVVDVEPLAPYTDADRARWREALLKKGGEVAAKLEELLAKKDKTLADFSLWGGDEPGETKERRLRRYFDHLMRRLRAVNHPRFGFDRARGGFATIAELDETPWLDLEP